MVGFLVKFHTVEGGKKVSVRVSTISTIISPGVLNRLVSHYFPSGVNSD